MKSVVDTTGYCKQGYHRRCKETYPIPNSDKQLVCECDCHVTNTVVIEF
jgi:hypothetical protein